MESLPARPRGPAQTLPAELDEAVQAFLRESRSANTRRAYRAALTAFAGYCGAVSREPVPASPETVAAYLSHQCRRT